MKNVILSLKNVISLTRFLPLIERVRENGISVHAYLAEEELPMVQDALFITDCKKTANELMEQKLPVLGFSHEEGEGLAGVDYIMEVPEEVDVVYMERVYRRYRDIPWDILETDRCIIRESIVEDVDGFFRIYDDSEVVKYMEDLFPDTEQEKAYIRQYIDRVYKYFEFGVWTVLSKETNEIIGRAGYSVRDGYELPELGFVIAAPWQHKGIAYEICSAILQYGKEVYEFEQVQALVRPENAASLALCRKLGFVEQETVTEKGKQYLLLVKEFYQN